MKLQLETDRPGDRVDAPIAEAEESLVLDARAGMSPAQWVEQKLIATLKNALPVSHLRLAALCRGRTHC